MGDVSYLIPWLLLLDAFFFFQAEDGIRDGRVTGVQTCALPISASRRIRTAACRRRSRSSFPSSPSCRRFGRFTRSEERREGKSVDLGGRRIIKKKKKREERGCEREIRGRRERCIGVVDA